MCDENIKSGIFHHLGNGLNQNTNEGDWHGRRYCNEWRLVYTRD